MERGVLLVIGMEKDDGSMKWLWQTSDCNRRTTLLVQYELEEDETLERIEVDVSVTNGFFQRQRQECRSLMLSNVITDL